jgi:hypothetical protein
VALPAVALLAVVTAPLTLIAGITAAAAVLVGDQRHGPRAWSGVDQIGVTI